MPAVLLMKDQRRKQPLKWQRKIPMLMRGFTSESVILYGLDGHNYKQYLSDYQLMKTRFLHKPEAYFLNHKVAFVDMLKDIVAMPRTLGLVEDGKYISRDPNFLGLRDIVAYLQASAPNKVVLKPILGAEGRDVSVVTWSDGKLLLNEKVMTVGEFKAYVATLDDYFFSDFIVQGDFSSGLYPHSLNTIRILTMIDTATKEAFIAAAVYRVGTDLSRPTDNFRRYGLSVAIDWQTGVLGEGARVPEDGTVSWHQFHPDTGVPITGQQIPHWDGVKAGVLAVADFIYKTKGIVYCGWDVVLTNDGLSLLEGNSIPGVSLIQVHRPLLVDPLVREFYEYYGVI